MTKPIPRQGFLLTAQIKSPYGDTTSGGIDISEIHRRSNCSWHLVLDVGANRDGSETVFKQGDFVYAPIGAAEAIPVENGRILGLLPEVHVKAYLPKGQYEPQLIEDNAADILRELRAIKNAAPAPQIVGVGGQVLKG